MAVTCELKLEGLDKLLKNINKAVEKINKASLNGVKETTINTAVKGNLEAPVDQGPLRRSETVKLNNKVIAKGTEEGKLNLKDSMVKTEKKINVGEISFNTPYALKQHEDLTFNHKEGTKAKYLEDPLKEESNNLVKNITKEIKKVIK